MVRPESRRALALASLAIAAALAGCGPPTIDVGTPFAIVATVPSGGAQGVAVDVLPQIVFNRDVDAASAESQIQILVGNTSVERTLNLKKGGSTVQLLPRHAFPADSDVTLVIGAEVESSDGVKLESPVDAVFHTAP